MTLALCTVQGHMWMLPHGRYFAVSSSLPSVHRSRYMTTAITQAAAMPQEAISVLKKRWLADERKVDLEPSALGEESYELSINASRPLAEDFRYGHRRPGNYAGTSLSCRLDLRR
jgi:hypothetical protein